MKDPLFGNPDFWSFVLYSGCGTVLLLLAFDGYGHAAVGCGFYFFLFVGLLVLAYFASRKK